MCVWMNGYEMLVKNSEPRTRCTTMKSYAFLYSEHEPPHHSKHKKPGRKENEANGIPSVQHNHCWVAQCGHLRCESRRPAQKIDLAAFRIPKKDIYFLQILNNVNIVSVTILNKDFTSVPEFMYYMPGYQNMLCLITNSSKPTSIKTVKIFILKKWGAFFWYILQECIIHVCRVNGLVSIIA